MCQGYEGRRKNGILMTLRRWAQYPPLAADAATVSAMMDDHARLRLLLQDAIMATPISDEDYWVGMGTDEVVVRGESAEVVMASIEAGGTAGGAVVLEFVSCKHQAVVL